MTPRLVAVAALLLLAATGGAATAGGDDRAVDPGEAIYVRGATSSGMPVTASRGPESAVEGQAAACANCHQRSGLGGREGRIVVPPITTRYLYRPRAGEVEERDIPFVAGMRGDREPYTPATLARAIRDGVDSEGRTLDFLMPRYDLGDADLAAVIDHLKAIDRSDVPGVTRTTLHFATIITPDADPARKSGMLAVMNQFIADRNARQMAPAPHLVTSGRTSVSGMMFKVQRQWKLHVWELTGPESTWQAQLERHLAAEPVFAVISGLGGARWAPVHAFCERQSLPCLFPNVDAPPLDADRDFYSVYFSRGVFLEAELLARHMLADSARPTPMRVLQVFREGDSGEAAAAAFEGVARSGAMQVSRRAIPRGAPVAAVAGALGGDPRADAVVLWLRPSDLAGLPPQPPAHAAIYLSGQMATLEHAPLPPAWRARVEMSYPCDLPDHRRVRVDFAMSWFNARHIALVSERTQIDTYLALGLLSETLKAMTDTFVRDYLVEHMEETLAHRIMTGYYPRLGMATGQRYASKGGYLVRFAAAKGTAVVAVGDWTVP